MEVKSFAPKFQMGKIRSKYVIMDVFSYAGEQENIMRYLSLISRKYRQMCIEN